MDLVSVEHDFEYTARDGQLVSIKPRETFILLAKTSAHWWRVCADLHSKPFYVPAEYVREVPLPSPRPPDPPDPPDPDPDAWWRPPPEEGPTTAREPEDSPPAPTPVARRDDYDNASRDFCRFSTFGFPESLLPDVKPWPPNAQSAPRRKSLTSSSMSGDVAGQTSTSEPPLLPAPPSPHLQGARRASLPEPPAEDQNHQTEPPCGNPQNFTHSPGGGGGGGGDGDDNKVIKYTMRRSFHTYETIEDVKCSEEGEEEEEEFPPPPVTSEQSLNHSAHSGLSEDCSPESQVEDDLYVNVAELRQRLSSQTDFADPHPYPDPSSYPYPDAFLPPDPEEEEDEEEEEQGWEVHTDQDSGQDYYYHPATGQTTWDRPVLLAGQGRCPSPHMNPSGPEETSTCFSPASPTPRSRSRSRSSSAASPPPLANAAPSWSDWEQLVDESSGRPYFYNAMSGETSWEPPQGAPLSPYSQLMRAAEEEEEEEEEGEESPVGRGGGRRRASEEEGPPPLPEEDYPSEDCPTVVADLAELLEDEDGVPVSPPGSPLSPTQEYSFIQGVPHSPAGQGSPHSPTQQEYNFSHVTRPTIPRASLDRQAPQGWDLTTEPDGTWVFTSKHSQEQWIKSLDDRGQTYYYLRDGSKSQWNLPEAPGPSSQGKVGNGVEADSLSTAKNWRHTMMGPVSLGSVHEETRFFPGHRRNLSDHGVADHPSSLGQQPPENQQHHVQNLEKAGILNKTKVCEHGKKVRKNWAQSWTVLHGGVLTFHKDPKSANTGASNKTNQIVPEVTVELRGATIGWAARDKSSKKNVIELKSKSGLEFLIQYDNDSIISDWHKVIVDTIRQLEYQDQHSEEEDDFCDKPADRDDRPVGTLDKRKASTSRQSISSHPSSSSSGETDQKKVRTKLIKFLMKRPTMQSLKDKGYIRDNVFGCHLATLCAQERTTVPSFVEKCIKAVEKRGLDIDGLYRVSGNLAVIQKLRYKADHEELDLEDGQWEDVHVITGALKLFFRELPEPLFPYNLFNDFIAAIRTQDYNTKVSYMRQLVRSLPPPNRHTMELLFGHLRKVIECGEDNRMTVQNVAIVFGPTLLRPEMESSNITMHMVFQNQIVEFVLNEYQNIFHSS